MNVTIIINEHQMIEMLTKESRMYKSNQLQMCNIIVIKILLSNQN